MILEFRQAATFDGKDIEMVPELDPFISVYSLEGTVSRRIAPDDMEVPIVFTNNNLVFSSQEIISYGVRSFPQLGPYAFWRERYSDNTKLIIPLYNKDEGKAPTLILQVVNGEVEYVIEPPEQTNYYCYKLHFTKGYFRRDLVTYELTGTVTLEPGDYLVSCRGYSRVGFNSALTIEQHITV